MSAADPAGFARRCVESLVTGDPAPAAPSEPLFAARAGCFVSIKRSGHGRGQGHGNGPDSDRGRSHAGAELRGCIGTLGPTQPDLAAEIAHNAASAALHDPRFPPISADELEGLSYSVDVLGDPEPCEASQLDPATYGVIVTSGLRRGVLLPDLPGVDSVEHQVDIALQKAGISRGEPFALQRFTVTRYREQGPDAG